MVDIEIGDIVTVDLSMEGDTQPIPIIAKVTDIIYTVERRALIAWEGVPIEGIQNPLISWDGTEIEQLPDDSRIGEKRYLVTAGKGQPTFKVGSGRIMEVYKRIWKANEEETR